MLEEDESEGHLGLSLDYELLAQRTLKDRGFIWRVFKIFFSTADTRQCELKISSRISYPLSLFYKGMLIQCHERKKRKSLSHVWLFVTPRTVAYQAPPSMEFSRQEYWSALSFPSPGDLPDPEMETRSLALAGRFFYHCATRGARNKTLLCC